MNKNGTNTKLGKGPIEIHTNSLKLTSSDAISSDVMTANFSGLIVPQRTFSLRDGFFLSFRLKTRLLTCALYLGFVCLFFSNILSSIISANSSGLLTTPSRPSTPSPLVHISKEHYFSISNRHVISYEWSCRE